MLKIILFVVGGLLGLLLLITGVRLILLKHSLTSYKTYWNKRAAEPAPKDALVYIALGDSTAQGIGASTPNKGYVGLMAKHLGEKTKRPVRVINISVSGAKIQDVIKDQIPQLKNLPKPDVLTIEAGANDMRTFDEKKFEKDFKELTAKLPDSRLPNKIIISNMPSFKGGRAAGLNKNVQKANEIILRDFPWSRLVPANLYLQTEDQSLRDFGADLFHPSDHGYQNWVEAFERAYDGPSVQ